jgi:hypothetical protein
VNRAEFPYSLSQSGLKHVIRWSRADAFEPGKGCLDEVRLIPLYPNGSFQLVRLFFFDRIGALLVSETKELADGQDSETWI